MNVIHLIGYLGKDPQERSFPNGDRVVNLTLATHKRLPPDTDGQRRERTDWHKIRVYSPPESGPAEVLLRYARKGTRLRVQGELVNGSVIDERGSRIPLAFIDVRIGSGEIELMDPPRQRTAGTPDAPGETGNRGRPSDPLETQDGLMGDDLS